MQIDWYEDDVRFEPGTTADMHCIRIKLRERKTGWSLLVEVRKADGSLSQSVKVKNIGSCSLEEAQLQAEEWYNMF